MAETLLTLRTEVQARGFDYLTDGRVNRFINDAYVRLCNMALWPFREITAIGAAPLTITDLGVLASVIDTSNGNNSLAWRDRRTLVDTFGDLTTAGTATYFYIEDGGTLRTYPVGGTLAVRYWRRAVKLVNDADVSIVPDDYSDVLIDMAVRRAYIDSDNFAAANALKADVDERIGQMMVDLLIQQVHDDNYITVSGGEEQM
jgi:hypothetical protein